MDKQPIQIKTADTKKNAGGLSITTKMIETGME
jgi:hypothetical protein